MLALKEAQSPAARGSTVLKVCPGPDCKSGRTTKKVGFQSPEGRKGLTVKEWGPKTWDEDAGLGEMVQDMGAWPFLQAQSGQAQERHKKEMRKII